MVGLNTNGELGTKDDNAKSNFTKIGYKDIKTNPEEINLEVRNK